MSACTRDDVTKCTAGNSGARELKASEGGILHRVSIPRDSGVSSLLRTEDCIERRLAMQFRSASRWAISAAPCSLAGLTAVVIDNGRGSTCCRILLFAANRRAMPVCG